MKLRLRHYQGGPTQRLDVEDSCTLRALRAAVVSLTGQDEASVRVSLNKKDELDGPGNLLVSSLGICGGDLLYLLDPRRPGLGHTQLVSDEFGSNAERLSVSAPLTTLKEEPVKNAVRPGVGKVDVDQERRERCAMAATKRLATGGGTDTSAKIPPGKAAVTDPMHLDIKEGPLSKKSVPQGILQQVVCSSLKAVHSGHDLLVLAIHAAMLETGFDLLPSGLSVEQCWERVGGRTTLQYTLASANPREAESDATCTLRCQQLGRNLVVYGSCDQDPRGGVYRLNLPLSEHLQTIPSANSLEGKSAEQVLALFKNARHFLMETKDALTLPLLTLLCQRAGVSPPPSLILLPVDGKTNILARLPAQNLVAVSATCTELRELASRDEFWKALFEKEFSCKRVMPGRGKWKEEFRRAWVERKLMREKREEYERQLRAGPRESRGFRFQPPGMVGGDYDRFPFGGGMGILPGGPGGFGGGMFGIPQGGAFPGGNLDGGFSPNLGADSLEWPHGGRAHWEAGRGPQGHVGMPGIPGSNLPGFGPQLRGGASRGGRPRGGPFSGSSII